MKILFVIPIMANYYGGENTKPRMPHIGVASLSAYLKREGHTTAAFDCNVEEDPGALFGAPLTGCDVVGITLYSWNSKEAYLFVNKVAAFLKNQPGRKVPVVLGGPHVTVTGKESLARTAADFAVQGEGELTFAELLSGLYNPAGYENIKGLVWRDPLGDIRANPPREFIQDMDALPFPDYSIFRPGAYMNQEINELPLNTSRGCPFECSFCAIHLVSGKKFRPRSPENILREITEAYGQGIRNFFFTDDAFNLDMGRAEEICDLIIRSGLDIKLVFQHGLRADRLDRNLVDKLKRAGTTTIALSAESGNPEVLKAIKKTVSPEDIRRASALLDEAGIQFIVNFIIGHPTETYPKAMDSLRLAEEMGRKKTCVTIMCLNLIPYPGTEVFDWIGKHGRWLLTEETFFNIGMSDTSPIFESPEFPRREREAMLRRGNRLHRALLLRFIFGAVPGSLLRLLCDLELPGRLMPRLAMSTRLGQGWVYTRYLRKLYRPRTVKQQ